MTSTQDKVDLVLTKMEQNNDPQAFSQGLNILNKLTANIVKEPFEQKYRSIKTTNNTIKNKIMSLRGIDELLTTLGFTRQNDEFYNLDDQRFYLFIQGEIAVDYKRRLAASKLSNQAEYEKQMLLIKLHKEQRANQRKRSDQTNRLKEMASYDKQERKLMKVDETKSRNLTFGSNTKTCKEMGIGVEPKGGKGKGG